MEKLDGLAYDYLEAFINEDGELEFDLKEVVISEDTVVKSEKPIVVYHSQAESA